jgi:hypothetical protein
MATNRKDTIWHGLMVGLIGYATIAISVSVGDLLQGRSPFFTVALFGEWLFYGLVDPAKVHVWPGPVFAYNGLHFVTFLGFGLLASWLASMSERGPLYWYAGLVVYLFVFVHLFAAVLLMTEPLRTAIPTLQILLPSLAAVVLMSMYLLRVHPQMRREMNEWVDEDDREDVPGEVGAHSSPNS